MPQPRGWSLLQPAPPRPGVTLRPPTCDPTVTRTWAGVRWPTGAAGHRALQIPERSAEINGVRLFVTGLLIWCAMSVPIALAVGRMLAGVAGGSSPGPPTMRQPAQNLPVRS